MKEHSGNNVLLWSAEEAARHINWREVWMGIIGCLETCTLWPEGKNWELRVGVDNTTAECALKTGIFLSSLKLTAAILLLRGVLRPIRIPGQSIVADEASRAQEINAEKLKHTFALLSQEIYPNWMKGVRTTPRRCR